LSTTASAGTANAQIATTSFVDTAITNERTATATLTNKTLTAPFVDSILFEGTADDYETTLAFADPTADRTITFPDKSGTVAMTSEIAVASSLFSSSGSYAIAGSTTLTVTATAHGRSVGDVVYLNFTSGTAVDGYFTVATSATNSFTVTYGSSITTSGSVVGYYSNVGTVAIASNDETIAGSSSTRVASAAGVQAAIQASKIQGTAVASTSGTSIDFTGIPSWVKRITVMFAGVSTNGTNQTMVQLGSGSVQTSGYLGTAMSNISGVAVANHSSGFLTHPATDHTAASLRHGMMVLTLVGSNTWVQMSMTGLSNTPFNDQSSGSVVLSGTLDRVVITTVGGTDTFDAGLINILYE
jgi:hypothetical protein